MEHAAFSFLVHARDPRQVIAAVVRHSGPTKKNGLLFLSGGLANRSAEIAQAIAVEARDTSWLIASAAGVLTENGEIEGHSAAVGLSLSFNSRVFVQKEADESFGKALAGELQAKPGSTACVLLRCDKAGEGWLAALNDHQPLEPHQLFGGGTLSGIDLYQVEDGIVRSGSVGVLMVQPGHRGQLCTSSACRLLSPLGKVTRARGPILHEIDGQPALDRLNESTHDLEEQTLVLLAVASGSQPLAPQGRSLALRAIQGVDPERGALIMNDEFPLGTQVAFAVRDAHASRKDLRAQLQNLQRESAGAAPSFGIYINCAGRGEELYGSSSVDTRLIHAALPQMPLVGLHSTFEFAPQGGRIVPQIYAGVLCVFSKPS